MFGGKGDVCLFIIEYTSSLSGFHCHGEMQWETLFKTSVSGGWRLQGAACTGKPAQITLLYYLFFFLAYLFDEILDNYTHFRFDFMVFFRELHREWIWRTNVGIKEPLHPSFCLVPEPNSIWIIQEKNPEWSASVLSSLEFYTFRFAAHLTCSKDFSWPRCHTVCDQLAHLYTVFFF